MYNKEVNYYIAIARCGDAFGTKAHNLEVKLRGWKIKKEKL